MTVFIEVRALVSRAETFVEVYLSEMNRYLYEVNVH